MNEADALVCRGSVAAGLALAQAAWPAVEASGDMLQMADCQRVICAAHQVAGRFQESVRAGYQAIYLYGRVNEPGGLARALGLQAIGLVRVGDIAEGLHLAALAVDALRELSGAAHAVMAARVWNNVSVVYEALGQFETAVHAVEAALALAAQGTDAGLRATCTGNLLLYRLAVVRQEDRLHDAAGLRALDEVLQHIRACDAAGRHSLVAGLAEVAGHAQGELHRADEARSTLRQGLRAARQAGLGPDLARIELRLAELERHCGQHRAASSHMATALDQAQQGDDCELLARCHLENSQLQETLGHWRAALDSARRHSELLGAMLRAQAQRRAQLYALELEGHLSQQSAEPAWANAGTP